MKKFPLHGSTYTLNITKQYILYKPHFWEVTFVWIEEKKFKGKDSQLAGIISGSWEY